MVDLNSYYRPKNLSEVCGQQHLVASNMILEKMISKNEYISMIFYGPSGCGKTTIANIIMDSTTFATKMLNAALNTKADFSAALTEAKNTVNYILIVDEIHRLNKDKQDILLQSVEKKEIILIGLTTVTPYHSVNPALRSRCLTINFDKLTTTDIVKRLTDICYKEKIKFDVEALKIIASNANGDVRNALIRIEALLIITEEITLLSLEKLAKATSINLNQDSQHYHDLISAFQKSIRGSDVNASILYLTALLEYGYLEEIIRRIQVIAYEDIGLANPQLCSRVHAACMSALHVGIAEAKFALAVTTIELALSPKSNSAYISLEHAKKDLATLVIPENIRHINNSYLYPHDYENSWINQQYLPFELTNKTYYKPKNNSHEQKLEQVLINIEKLKNS